MLERELGEQPHGAVAAAGSEDRADAWIPQRRRKLVQPSSVISREVPGGGEESLVEAWAVAGGENGEAGVKGGAIERAGGSDDGDGISRAQGWKRREAHLGFIAPRKTAPYAGAMGSVSAQPPRRTLWQVPGIKGLCLALGVYALLVLAFVSWRYWSSPEYQAAVHWEEAAELLGSDGGRGISREKLIEAYEHLLEAARLMPQVRTLHERLESLNWRFEERGLQQPEELRRRAEAVAAIWQRIQQEQAPLLVVGMRDRGWAPSQLREGPGTVLAWSSVGVLALFVLWGYWLFNGKRQQEQKHLAELQRLEKDVADAERARRKPQRR